MIGFVLLVISLAVCNAAPSVSVKSKVDLSPFRQFLREYQLVIDNQQPGAATLFAGSEFSANSTWINVPASGAAFTSSFKDWPFNGVYGASRDFGGKYRLVLSDSVGPVRLFVMDVSTLPPKIVSTTSLDDLDCESYLLSSDPKRGGVWLVCGSGMLFVSGYGTASAKLVSVTDDVFKGTDLDGFTLPNFGGGQPTGYLYEDTMWVVATKMGKNIPSEGALAALAISAGSPPKIASDASRGVYKLSQNQILATVSCSETLYVVPTSPNSLLVLLPAFNDSAKYYCNGNILPTVSAQIFNSQNLKPAGPLVFGPSDLLYSAFSLTEFGKPGQYLLKSFYKDFDANFFTTFSALSVNGNSVTFGKGFTQRYVELYNAPNKAVLSKDGTIKALVEETLLSVQFNE